MSKQMKPLLHLTAKNLKRTWYIQTDEDGKSIACFLSILQTDIKSDEFYYTSAENPNPAVPIGTVVIREVKAPDGYSLSNVVFYRNLSDSVIAIMKDTNTPINVPIDEMPAKAYVGINKLNQSGIVSAEQYMACTLIQLVQACMTSSQQVLTARELLQNR